MNQAGQDKPMNSASRRSSADQQSYFYDLADHLTSILQGQEVFNAGFAGEDSDFVRINRAAVRQAGAVSQRSLTLDLIDGARHAAGDVTLSGEHALDQARLDALLVELREKLPHLPEDPHLLYSTEVHSTEHHGADKLPDATSTVTHVLDQVQGKDFVGLWASGGILSGFANSLGQRNWFSTYTFNLDWSLYHQGDKAVKTSYAGFEWDPAQFRNKLDAASEQLTILARPARTIDPGAYRVYLAPVALNEILTTLSWGGFGLKSQKTKLTPLLRMMEDGTKLHPSVSLSENTKEGVAPNFQGAGFLKPDRVALIDGGAYRDCLVSPRSAKEYNTPTNGSSEWEEPESLDLSAGDLSLKDVLARLETGVYINNLWYLNYSDRSACRLTGMTRFACFWVEKGVITAPLNVMRFDESIYRALGENLLGLTREREMILSSETYFRRSTRSARLPGALIDGFSFTL
jgi:predicted Zn-dependent protease